jgi:hypothetical protein
MPETVTYSVTTPTDANEEWATYVTSTNLTVQNGQTVVLASAASGAITITLPDAASTNTDRVILVKKTDASVNAVTIATTGGDTIDGASTKSLSTQYASYTFVSDGSNWHIV